MIWNVAGIKNKGHDFWKIIKNVDVIFMLETWIESTD